jgi:Zn-dependent M28 family amino/carboxypeptidase
VAQELAESGQEPANRVRFAFWGAEELGLLGSAAYVSSLDPDQLVDLGLYLNFDMVASPNFARFVYDGDGSSFGLVGPAGSQQIEALFTAHFDAEGLPHAGTEFSGRSDYQAFIENGVPAGGLFTGAEGVKTEEEAALFGGVAGAAYDPCYHLACDTLAAGEVEGRDPAVYGALTDLVGNVNTVALETNTDAIAHAVATYAQDTTAVNGVTAGGPGGGPVEGPAGGGGAAAPAEAAALLR